MADKMIQLNKGHKTAKRIAIVLCGLMVVIILFSAFYVVSEAGHDCCGDCCPICVQIDQCNALLRSAGEGTAALITAFMLALAVSIVLISSAKNVFLPTLVTQNVRMNN